MKALTIDHLISKRWGGICSDHIEYDISQDKGDESDPITFRQYSSNMTAKTGKYDRDQLFHAISRDNDSITIHFMYFPYRKV